MSEKISQCCLWMCLANCRVLTHQQEYLKMRWSRHDQKHTGITPAGAQSWLELYRLGLISPKLIWCFLSHTSPPTNTAGQSCQGCRKKSIPHSWGIQTDRAWGQQFSLSICYNMAPTILFCNTGCPFYKQKTEQKQEVQSEVQKLLFVTLQGEFTSFKF